jgi:hypothetical protein
LSNFIFLENGWSQRFRIVRVRVRARVRVRVRVRVGGGGWWWVMVGGWWLGVVGGGGGGGGEVGPAVGWSHLVSSDVFFSRVL